MDFIVRFTIGLFIFSILLLFFKTTKTLSSGQHINTYTDFHEIMNRDYQEPKSQENDLYSYDLPRNLLQDPNDIVWKINN